MRTILAAIACLACTVAHAGYIQYSATVTVPAAPVFQYGEIMHAAPGATVVPTVTGNGTGNVRLEFTDGTRIDFAGGKTTPGANVGIMNNGFFANAFGSITYTAGQQVEIDWLALHGNPAFKFLSYDFPFTVHVDVVDFATSTSTAPLGGTSFDVLFAPSYWRLYNDSTYAKLPMGVSISSPVAGAANVYDTIEFSTDGAHTFRVIDTGMYPAESPRLFAGQPQNLYWQVVALPTLIPEPSTWALAVLVLVGVAVYGRRGANQ